MSENAQETVTTREAAQILDISLRTAQLWVESGVLKAWKTAGGHRRILRSSIDELLRKRTRDTSQMKGPDAPKNVSEGGKFKILVVEDDPALGRLYQLTIAGWSPPVELRAVKNGWEALLAIGEDPPNTLITDLRMPGMDGFRMMRVLTSSPEVNKGIQIIVVTGMDRGEIEAFGGLPPEVEILHKPISFAALEKLVIEQRLRQSGKLPERNPEAA